MAAEMTETSAMETVVCNLCGSDHLSVVYTQPDNLFFPDEFFQIVECNRCGLGFVNPRPTAEGIGKYYPPEYYDDFSNQHTKHLKRYAIEATYLAEKEGLSRPSRLLDVGCANGDFPRFMRARGWEVEGVEVSTTSRQITDFPVHNTWFPNIPVYEPRYDAITAWAVLEHVHDPKSYFQKAAEVLNPGGLFVFLVTNFHSLASHHLFAEDIPRHLYFFTEESVKAYLQQNGFILVRVDYSNALFSMSPTGWLTYSISRLLGRDFVWPPPLAYTPFIKERGLLHGWRSFLKFALHAPLSAVDRLFLPLIERLEIWRRTYGIVIYVARKKE